MQIAGVDLYIYHGVLGIGASRWMPLSLQLTPDEPAASCDTHVLVKVRGQHELTRVRLFKVQSMDEPSGDPAFITVHDSGLLLDDARMTIGDVVGGSSFTTAMIHEPGRHRVIINLNTADGDATAVDVIVVVPGPLPYYMTTDEPPAPVRTRTE